MFISYNWLRELTNVRLNPEEVRERLTNVGLAVDAVEQRGDDYVLDVEVPSNRGDCLSHVGIARELAAIERSRVSSFKFPKPRVLQANLPLLRFVILISARAMPRESLGM